MKRCVVVAVNLFAGESEGMPFIGKRVHANCVLGEVTLLDTISIDDDDQVIQLIVVCRHGCLPVGAFLQLAVSRQNEGSPALPVDLCCKRTTDGDRKSMPEWTS